MDGKKPNNGEVSEKTKQRIITAAYVIALIGITATALFIFSTMRLEFSGTYRPIILDDIFLLLNIVIIILVVGFFLVLRRLKK